MGIGMVREMGWIGVGFERIELEESMHGKGQDRQDITVKVSVIQFTMRPSWCRTSNSKHLTRCENSLQTVT